MWHLLFNKNVHFARSWLIFRELDVCWPQTSRYYSQRGGFVEDSVAREVMTSHVVLSSAMLWFLEDSYVPPEIGGESVVSLKSCHDMPYGTRVSNDSIESNFNASHAHLYCHCFPLVFRRLLVRRAGQDGVHDRCSCHDHVHCAWCGVSPVLQPGYCFSTHDKPAWLPSATYLIAF